MVWFNVVFSDSLGGPFHDRENHTLQQQPYFCFEAPNIDLSEDKDHPQGGSVLTIY
jgi:hypothetical protein